MYCVVEDGQFLQPRVLAGQSEQHDVGRDRHECQVPAQLRTGLHQLVRHLRRLSLHPSRLRPLRQPHCELQVAGCTAER